MSGKEDDDGLSGSQAAGAADGSKTPFYALRTFRIDGQRKVLLPLSSLDGETWEFGRTLAQCGRGHGHVAPSGDCTCGIHGWLSLAALRLRHRRLADSIVAVISCDDVFSWTDGELVRTMAGRVVAYWCAPAPVLDRAREVFERTCPDAQEFTDLNAMVRAYDLVGRHEPSSAPLRAGHWPTCVVAMTTWLAIYGRAWAARKAHIGGWIGFVAYGWGLLVGAAVLSAGAVHVGHLSGSDPASSAARDLALSARDLLRALAATGLPIGLLAVVVGVGMCHAMLLTRGGRWLGPAVLATKSIRIVNAYVMAVFVPLLVFCGVAHAHLVAVVGCAVVGCAVMACYVATAAVHFWPVAADAVRAWQKHRAVKQTERAWRKSRAEMEISEELIDEPAEAVVN